MPGSCSNSTGVLASCLDLGKCHDCHHGLLVEGMRLLFDGCIGNLELYCEVSLLRTCFWILTSRQVRDLGGPFRVGVDPFGWAWTLLGVCGPFQVGVDTFG